MTQLLPFIVVGLVTGSLYGIAAMGLVLTYKTSGIFNFAHGAIAAGAAYLFFQLHYRNGLPWPLAATICIFAAAPLAGILIERIAHGLEDAPSAAKIVATVGLLLVVQGTVTSIYGASAIDFPQFLPTQAHRLFGINVGTDQLITIAIAGLAAVGLYGFFRFSRLGLAIRGVVDNPDLINLAGTSPRALRTRAWMIGSSFAAASGILLAPTIGLDPVLLTFLVLQAFGAAAVGFFRSLPLTYVGGLVVGVGGALSTKYVVDFPNLAWFPASFPFLVLFAVLLFAPRGKLVEAGGVNRPQAPEHTQLSPALTWICRVAGLALLLMVPQLVGPRLTVYINGVIFVLVFLSLRLLVRTSGQVSLCHAAFAAVGAAGFAHFASSNGLGLPWLLALVLAGLVTIPIGAVVAVPAIRLSGLYLALATFGLGILVERIGFTTGLMFGRNGSRAAPRPSELFGIRLNGDRAFYYVCLAIVILACLIVFAVNRSRLGRLLLAMADSPTALAVHGTSVNVTRVLVFCISALLAGIAGALFASLSGSISGAGFTALNSLIWLVVLSLAGRGEFSAPFLAAMLLAAVPSYVRSEAYIELQPVIFGAVAIAGTLAAAGRPALASWLQRRSTERSTDRARSSPVWERMHDLRRPAQTFR